MASSRFGVSCVAIIICSGVIRPFELRADEKQPPANNPAIHGIVVDPDGRPIAGAMILWDPRGGNLFEEYGANRIPKSDAEGKFELPGVPHTLTIFSLDWQLRSVRVQAPVKEPLKIVMKRGKRVEFRTVDPQGHPISGISFYPEAPRGASFDGPRHRPYFHVLDFLGHRNLIRNRSDESGRFVWENAPDESLAYQIVSPDVLSQPGGEYGPDDSPHTLVFRKTIPVNATVVDAATGEAIPKYEILLGTHFKSDKPGSWSWHTQIPKGQGQAGRFSDVLRTLDRLIRYRVQAEGYRPVVSASLDAANLPDDPVALEFRLQKQNGYTGTLLTPDGSPAVGATVYVKAGERTQNGRLMEMGSMKVVDGSVDATTATSSVTTEADGKFQLASDKVPFTCFVSHESGYAELMDVELLARTEHTLVPWAAVDGQLFVKGAPAPNVSITADQTDLVRNTQVAVTDAAGRYAFTRCVAGPLNERIVHTQAPLYRQDLELELAPGRTIVQRLGADGCNLIGRLRLPKDADVRDVSWVRLVQLKEQPVAPGGKPRLSGTQRIRRSVHHLELQSDDSFQLFNLLPLEQEMTISLSLRGADGFDSAWSKVIQITPDMFTGKNTRTPIDLGEIEVKPEE